MFGIGHVAIDQAISGDVVNVGCCRRRSIRHPSWRPIYTPDTRDSILFREQHVSVNPRITPAIGRDRNRLARICEIRSPDSPTVFFLAAGQNAFPVSGPVEKAAVRLGKMEACD